MITALLLADAALLAILGPAVLRRAAWVERAPRIGILAWQVLSASVVLAVGFAGLALAISSQPVSLGLAGLLRACVMSLQRMYAAPGGALLQILGLLVALAVFGRCLACLLTGFVRAGRLRRRHHARLALVGRPHPWPGVTLLDHEHPAVYCLAGRPHRIVLTAGADRLLDEVQLTAVLAHERAHLRGRHHLIVEAANALARAFPRIPVFGRARDEITRLVELAADDDAGRASHRLTLAEAILNLADHPAPATARAGIGAGALAVAETAPAARIRRLIRGHRPVGPAGAGIGMVLAALMLAIPALILTTPAATAMPDCCNDHAPQAQPAVCQGGARDHDCDE